MACSSVLSPERRIELNPFDVDAWNLLLRESQVCRYLRVQFRRCILSVVLGFLPFKSPAHSTSGLHILLYHSYRSTNAVPSVNKHLESRIILEYECLTYTFGISMLRINIARNVRMYRCKID
uniref:Uncharacterized protein n=1 Tax=Heterorhabditis bacteriophora TaxID=37862 RepID=A0A1I7XUB9_HETBA